MAAGEVELDGQRPGVEAVVAERLVEGDDLLLEVSAIRVGERWGRRERGSSPAVPSAGSGAAA